MGRPPALKQKARSLARRQTAMQLLAKGEPITAIAEQLCVTTRQVRFYLSAALETESFYPSSLDGQQIGQLRQIEGERLTNLWHKAQLALDQIQPRLGSDGERNNDGIAVARLIESGTRVSERIARLFGLDVPTKTVSEVFSLLIAACGSAMGRTGTSRSMSFWMLRHSGYLRLTYGARLERNRML